MMWRDQRVCERCGCAQCQCAAAPKKKGPVTWKTDQIVLLTRALLVISRDPKISAWLAQHDPKALAQVQDALERAGYDPPGL